MIAECGENYLKINLSKGVTIHVTPTLLISSHEHRIIPFNMIKQRKGNWKEVKEWFASVLGWRIDFKDKTPIDTDKELDLINRFKNSIFQPESGKRHKKGETYDQ